MSREQLLERTAAWFDAGGLLQEMRRRVAIASASDNQPAAGVLEAYLSQEMRPQLEALDFECSVLPNPVPGNGPMLIARRIEDPALPTVLSYGHGDTVSGQDASWRAGLSPWTLTVEGDRWYGRGTADNKGQHSINLAALRQVVAARGGRLGYNVTLLLEMGEETGSPGLREVCAQQRDLLRADVFIASDGPRVHAQRPTLFMGSRGIVNFALRLKYRDRAFHSGNWGGVLANPGIVMAHALATLTDARGRIRVEGLRPRPPEAAVRQALQGVEIGGDADDPAIDPAWGEPGLSAAERLMAWNTLEVLALGCGSPERPINAIPASAIAHCQLRFVPGTPWQDLQGIVQRHLESHGFPDIAVEVLAATPATRLGMHSPWIEWLCDSAQRSVGKRPTVLPNLAGSLPNDAFAEILGLPTLWLPHSYPACAQHAPNEHLLASVAREGLLLMAGVFWDLGEPRHAPWSAGGEARSVPSAETALRSTVRPAA
ncbi:MAG: M20 family metallopeptidase [Rhodoferax sp.]|nr:M20 family metallopeptidase [Rhodoferax sp.]